MKAIRLFVRDVNRMLSGGPLPSWHGPSIKWLSALAVLLLLLWAVMIGYMLA